MNDLLLLFCAPWVQDAIWAPHSTTAMRADLAERCARCKKVITWGGESSRGQVVVPFQLNRDKMFTRGWCRECGELDMIPWRESTIAKSSSRTTQTSVRDIRHRRNTTRTISKSLGYVFSA
ncbi:hypothetical protein F5883DRAFT_22557 [Diaporthe sp. PMI_573]|nr:hypothetical protein F5883DRAFT_22557 [Diaporthaceae sp. PMI_573]